jgi:hypothetical protein
LNKDDIYLKSNFFNSTEVSINYTDKKEKKIFLIYKEIQTGSGAKSNMRTGFLIRYMRKCPNFSPYMRRALVIYDFAPDPS